LLTSGFTAAFNADPVHGPMISLPLAIFQFVKSPEPTMIARGFGTAAVLMLLVVLLFVIARVIGGQTVAKKERARQRREAIWLDLKAFGTGCVSVARRVFKKTIELPGAVQRSIRRLPALSPSSTAAKPTSGSADEPQTAKSKKSSKSKKSKSSSKSRDRQEQLSFEEFLELNPRARGTQVTTPDDDAARTTRRDKKKPKGKS